VVAAKAVFFPLDQQLELEARAWSEGVERTAVWLSGVVASFELVEEVLRRVGQVEMSRSTIWRRTQQVGAKFQAVARAACERANALPAQGEAVNRTERSGQRMGVALDGAILNIRKEGWKEVKIGCLFEIAVLPSQDKGSGEWVDLAHAAKNSYVAHLGGPDTLGEMAWSEAQRRGWEQAQETQVLGDGAPWIWNQAALHFPDSYQVVDWYHAKQHLSEAARLLKGDGTSAYRRWLNSRTTWLYQGQAEQIANELATAALPPSPHADALAREAAYFRQNHKRMNYLEMREEEWPIGSGMVESGAKQFKARFSGPGMRWSRNGAQNLLPIRSAVLSNHFDHFWEAARLVPPN
jgi:hypothetical protein